MGMRFYLRKLLNLYRKLERERANAKRCAVAKQALSGFVRPYCLHLGCGKVHLDGWVNVDLDDGKAVDITLDVTWPLPMEDGSCEFIYSEHMLEHLTAEQGVAFLKECYRLLAAGGTLRIAMPSLDLLIQRCHEGSWRDADWLIWPEYKHVSSRAEMLNMAFREWGHQWLYDREELYRRLREAGFEKIADSEWGVSTHAKLCGRETRKDSMLIAEAGK